MKKCFYLLAILALLLQPGLPSMYGASAQVGGDEPQAPNFPIHYVKPIATGTGNCSSWANACGLQTALGAAVAGDEIWVQAGTYKPTSSTDRTLTFSLKSGVELYGGFAGTETSREQRNWVTNVSTLSGDIGAVGDASDNSYHVVTGSNVDWTAILDGFTISGGKANGAGADRHNTGAGVLTTFSSPRLTNLIIRGNSASNMGGGMFNYNGSPALTNVIFIGNSAPGGGALENFIATTPLLTNVTFSGNTAYSGGAIDNYDSTPVVRNSILWGNTGGEIANRDPDSSTTVTYSDVQGGYAGTGNIDADPQFVRSPSPGADGTWGTADDDYGDLRLQLASPAIDAGENAAVPAGATTDLLGLPRFVDIASVTDSGSGAPPIVDMGAYEAQIVVYLPVVRK